MATPQHNLPLQEPDFQGFSHPPITNQPPQPEAAALLEITRDGPARGLAD